MYKKAAKLKLRFNSKVGHVTTEQLFDLDVERLDAMAVALEEEYKKSGKKSFLIASTAKDKITKLKFDIVLDVLNTKLENAAKASKSAETKAHNNKILSLIAEKQDGELAGKSVEELTDMLK
jgi:hypothetical protein